MWLRRLFRRLGFLGTFTIAAPVTFLVWSLFEPASERGDLWAAAFWFAAVGGLNVALFWSLRRHNLRHPRRTTPR